MSDKKKVLLCHKLNTAINELYETTPDWDIKVVDFDELLAEVRTGKYQALIIDVIGPEVFMGDDQFAYIGRHESQDGELMAFRLGLRFREAYPNLPIAILGDAGIPGGREGVQLYNECRARAVHVIDISNIGYVVKTLNEEMAANK